LVFFCIYKLHISNLRTNQKKHEDKPKKQA